MQGQESSLRYLAILTQGIKQFTKVTRQECYILIDE